MSGRRWTILLLMLLQLSSVGCQTDGAGQFAWNPFRSKAEVEANADSESSATSVSRNFFARRQESKEETDSAPPLATEQLERLLSQGRFALQENRVEDAKKAYSEVLQSLPDNATAHHGLAMAADLTEKWDEAEYHYRQALRVRPKDPDLLCDIGYSYLLQNRYSEAESYLTHALEVSPQHESAMMNLAMLDLRQGKRASAERRLAERFGPHGGAAQVLAQLDEQLASLDGSVISAVASSNTAAGSGSAAFRPDLDGSDRAVIPTSGVPEISANASMEEVLAVARREGAEAERRRMAQTIGREPAANADRLSPENITRQATASTGIPQRAADMNMSPLVSDRSVFPQSTGHNSSGYPSRPTHIFGTLQPRNTSLNSVNIESTGVSGTTVVPGGISADGRSIDQLQGADARSVPASPSWQAGVPGLSEIKTQSASVSDISPDSSAGVIHPNSEKIAVEQSRALSVPRGNMGDGASISPMTSKNQFYSEAGQGTSANSGKPADVGAPIAVRSSGVFQPAANSGNSYGVPYGFGSNHGEPSFSTVSNSKTVPMSGQEIGAENVNEMRSATGGMYLDGLNVGPGSLFPIYPNSPGTNSMERPETNINGDPPTGVSGNPSTGNSLIMNGSGLQPRMEPAKNTNPANTIPGNLGAYSNPGGGPLRMGNISSPGTGSMINGAAYAPPESMLPSAGVAYGGGINSNSNLPGWPAVRPAQSSPLEAYERQRQQLDDEYNRTLEQLDRNNPMSGSRAQY